MTKKPLTDNQLYGKVLSTDELMDFILGKELPNDIDLRLERWRKANCKTTEPSIRRQINAMKQGLTIDQLKPGLKWKRMALVLPVKHCRCTSCDTNYEGPCGPVMVKAHHNKLGTHWKKPEEGIDLSDLPREFVHIHEEIATCPNCFMKQAIKFPLMVREV